MGIDYASEKFGSAVRALAVSTRCLQDRIESAYMQFHPVDEAQDLPEELRDEYRRIVRDISHVEAKGNEGNLRATLSQMDEETAHSIINRILTLANKIEMLYYKNLAEKGLL